MNGGINYVSDDEFMIFQNQLMSEEVGAEIINRKELNQLFLG